MDSKNIEKTAMSPKSRRRLLPRMGELVLYAVMLVCVAMLITQDPAVVLRIFYSPFIIFLVIVVFVTFLIVKGGDRSRLYLLELERMREREQHYIGRMRRAHDEIQRTLQRNDPSAPPSEGTPSPLPPADPEECLRRIETLLRPDIKE